MVTLTKDPSPPGTDLIAGDVTTKQHNALVDRVGGESQHTGNRAAALDATGNLTPSATTDAELAFVSGVTSAIQTQINSKAPLVSPSFTTPNLGTPSAGVATNMTGLPLTTGVTGVLPIANGGTNLSALGSALQILRVNAGATALEYATAIGGGDAQTADPLSQFAATTSAQLAGVISDETGTGSVVFSNSPTLVTPALGTIASGVATNITGLPLTTGVTGILPVANGGTNLSAIGTALQVLRVNAGATALEYADPAGGGASWEENSLVSAAASLTLTLSTAAKEVELIIEANNVVIGDDIIIQVNGDTAARYTFGMVFGSTSISSVTATSQTSLKIMNTGGLDRPTTANIVLRRYDGLGVQMTGTSVYTQAGVITAAPVQMALGGFYNQDVDITSVVLLTNGGNLEAGARIRALIRE